MNPAEIKAQRESARIVRLTNPFDFEYTHAWGGIPYTLPMGKPLLLPAPLADHLATHLARQAMIRKAPMRDASQTDGKGTERPLWNDDTIAELKKQILVDEYQETVAPVKTEAEMLRDKIEELNKRFDDMEAEKNGTQMANATDPIEPTTNEPVIADASKYLDKAEVIAELDKRGIKYDARASKANLELLLA